MDIDTRTDTFRKRGLYTGAKRLYFHHDTAGFAFQGHGPRDSPIRSILSIQLSTEYCPTHPDKRLQFRQRAPKRWEDDARNRSSAPQELVRSRSFANYKRMAYRLRLIPRRRRRPPRSSLRNALLTFGAIVTPIRSTREVCSNAL